MPNFQAITRTGYANRHWKRPSSYAFAQREALIPLAVTELPPAAMSLPIALIARGDVFFPAAVTSFLPDSNRFLAPTGRWTGGYIPAYLRAYPFALVKAQNGQHVLCVDADSPLLSDHEGEPFFAADGQPGAALAGILEFLEKVAAGRAAGERACAALHKHQLIQAWPIQVQSSSGPRNVNGLFRVDEAALNALPTEAFEEIRKAGALPLAYCQLLSMQHAPRLLRLAEAPQAPADKPALDALNQGGTLRFGPL